MAVGKAEKAAVVNLRMTPEEKEQMQKWAEKDDRSVSQLIRQAVKFYARYKKL